jgi:hypothetical protein
MATMIRIWDSTLPGERVVGIELDAPVGTALTVGELVRARVEAEVRRYNDKMPEVFQGLVQPEESERLLNGYRMGKRKPVDADVQVRRAVESFRKNGFLILVNGRQVEDLEERVDDPAEAEIEFVKLVPLIGG